MTIHGIGWKFQLSSFWTAVFIILTILIVGITFFCESRYVASKIWLCPECSKAFRRKWYQCLFPLHWGSSYLLRCPHCGKKNLCSAAEHSRPEDFDL